ncbi:MAG: tetratricopeptide repeat protein [FCB group bacterium]|nr:tetratricopeptide repeat protein [FCB group bacterium]
MTGIFKLIAATAFLIVTLTGQKAPETITPLPDFDSMWNYNDPAASEKVFRDLLPNAKRSRNKSYYAQLLTQIARAQGLQDNFTGANETLDRVQNLLTDEMIVARVRYLLERGRVLNSSGSPEKAKPLFLQAWELATANGKDYWAVDVAHMLGIVEPPEKQLYWSLKALTISEKTTDPRAKGWRGPLYNNIGWTYHDLGQFDTALVYFQKGLKWREKIGDQAGALIAKWTVGRTFRSLGRLDEALDLQKKLEQEISEKALPPDGYVFEELGELYLLKGDQENSRRYFKLAYDILSQDSWLQKNQPDRLARLKKMGE